MPKVPFWVFILLALLFFSAVRVNTMDIDASQYAEISREMAKSGDYLHIYDRGLDYLDKPPFLFWVSALSIKVFGVNNFAYKLPSILFALLAVYATYRLTKLLYDEATARMAALILGCCQGMFLMTNDVRCDTILMSWVIMAIWLIKEWDINRKLFYLLAGCAAIACGMMTKGPIALMVPIFAFASDWILKREWRNFFKPAYLSGLILIAILLIPMSIGLYQQFDLHPEKWVNGKQGLSGLRFFYWSQSFGRITGESPWNNGADISFLLVNMLWSFLPWIFLFITAIIVNIRELIKQKFKLLPQQEWLSTGGFLLAYLSLGSSHYQLPHYIFVAFPLAAIMVAKLLRDFFEGEKYRSLYKAMQKVQAGLMLLLFIACLALITFVFPIGIWGVIAWCICFGAWLYISFKKQLCGRIFWMSALGIMLVNIFVTNQFYYQLLKYQLGSEAGVFIRQQGIKEGNVIAFKVHDPLNSLHFYAQQVVPRTDTLPDIAGKNYVLTMDDGLKEIQAAGGHYDIVKQGVRFKVSELTGEFLNPATRPQAVDNYYLVKIKK